MIKTPCCNAQYQESICGECGGDALRTGCEECIDGYMIDHVECIKCGKDYEMNELINEVA